MQLDGGGAVKMGFEARVFVSENEQMVEGDRILGQIFVRWHVWKKKRLRLVLAIKILFVYSVKPHRMLRGNLDGGSMPRLTW